jgi:hypothetical protein
MHPRIARGLLPWLLLLAVAVVGATAPSQARACRCSVPEHGFVVPEGGVLPANAAGLPWHGWPRSVENFEVVEITPTAELPRTAKIHPVSRDRSVPGRWASTVVVGLEEGLQPGASYRFGVRATEGGIVTGQQQQAVVRVSETALVAPEASPLLLGALEQSKTTIATGGRCSASRETARREVSLLLPDLSEEARNSLFYLTLVDGKPWREQSSTCKPPVPGETWKGRARDLLFTLCPELPRRGLASGTHSIQMLALLPGTDIVIRSEVVSGDFSCAAPAESPE